jgi:hypothetical protein
VLFLFRELRSLKVNESSTYDQKESMSITLKEKTKLADELEQENEQLKRKIVLLEKALDKADQRLDELKE